MKINQLTIIVLTSLVFSVSAIAQEYTFKVLVNKGKNEVKAGNAWQPLKTGSTLKSTDEVKLLDNAYLGLIHATGKPLELKQAGNYKVIDLAAKVSGGGTSVLNKYTDFILSANTDKKNRLSATGAVHRGDNLLKIYLPSSESAIVYGSTIILDWEKKPGVSTYSVSLKSMFGDDLLSTETNESTLTIDLNDAKFQNEDNITVEVYAKGQQTKKTEAAYMVKRLSTADKKRIDTLLKEIQTETMDTTSALNQLILAGFYEQNKLLIDATTAYLQAIKLAPDVQQYKDDYNNFLLRNQMKEVKKDK
jgi:hypothetical protein